MYYMGIDIGSTATKVVILDENKEITATSAVQLGTGSSGPQKALEDVFDKLEISFDDIEFTVVTGYGRTMFDRADLNMSEITCHAKGVFASVPGVRTIIDIGGQDVKALRLSETGMVDQFVMNDKCAAGTGRFLEVMSKILEVDVSELGELSMQAENAISISNTCTVFAESEVISSLSNGHSREDVAAGIHKSVAKRVTGLAKRAGIVPVVVLTGGVARNKGMLKALETEMSCEIKTPENPQLTGALGAAILAVEKSV